MLYITGSNDSLGTLYLQEGVSTGLSYEEYKKRFLALNPQLAKTLPIDFERKKLPPYIAIQPVSMPGDDQQYTMEVSRIVNGYQITERQALRVMQEENHDIPSSVATMGMMQQFQEFLSETKKKLSEPVIPTSMYTFDKSLTNKSLIKLSGEGLKHAGHLKETSTAYLDKNNLFALMKKRDELNYEWLQLKGKKGVDVARKALEKQTKDLTAQIKKLIPKRMSESAQRYIHGYDPQEAKKLANNASSLKLARKGGVKIKATHLDRLNKTGLATQRNMIKGFKVLGNGVKKFATYTNYGLAAYAIGDTYASGGNVARTAFREGTGLYASTLLTAAVADGLAGLGSIAIGSLAGDAALGATLLVCYPVVGWVVLAIGGAVIAGYVSYQAKDIAERVWDGVESGYVKEKAWQLGRWIYEDFKWFGEHIMNSD